MVIKTPSYILYCFRNGCRPFIEVYHGEQRVLTTVKEIEKMRWDILNYTEINTDYYFSSERSSDLMVGVLDFGSSNLGSIPGQGHCIVFRGKTPLIVPFSTQVCINGFQQILGSHSLMRKHTKVLGKKYS